MPKPGGYIPPASHPTISRAKDASVLEARMGAGCMVCRVCRVHGVNRFARIPAPMPQAHRAQMLYKLYKSFKSYKFCSITRCIMQYSITQHGNIQHNYNGASSHSPATSARLPVQ